MIGGYAVNRLRGIACRLLSEAIFSDGNYGQCLYYFDPRWRPTCFDHTDKAVEES